MLRWVHTNCFFEVFLIKRRKYFWSSFLNLTMPRRRREANIGRRTRAAVARANSRANENDNQRDERLAGQRGRNADTPRMKRTAAQRIRRNFAQRAQNIANRPNLEFDYDANIDYQQHAQIGGMDEVCALCSAKKFLNETAGMCCASGKVKLPLLEQPPQPLQTLISGSTPESQHFLQNIQAYNNCFQMTSFGATQIIRDGYMPTFKVNNYPCDTHFISEKCLNDNMTNPVEQTDYALQIQGQIYHQAGSLLPFADADYQFLQIYFIGNDEEEANRRCNINSSTRREIILRIQTMLHRNNELVRMFKTAIDRMPSDNHQIIIRPDKAPPTEHSRRYNAPTIDDVAIVIVGEQFQRRDIVLQRRNDQLMRVPETHRSYDSLQYPLMFPRGEDGYHLTMKMINPVNGK